MLRNPHLKGGGIFGKSMSSVAVLFLKKKKKSFAIQFFIISFFSWFLFFWSTSKIYRISLLCGIIIVSGYVFSYDGDVFTFWSKRFIFLKGEKDFQQLPAWEDFLCFSTRFHVLEIFRGNTWSLPLAGCYNLNVTVLFSEMKDGRTPRDMG